MGSKLEDDRLTKQFRHDALFYAGESDFVEHCARFIRGGLEASEPVLVAVIPRKIDLLKEALGADAGEVMFVDMSMAGRNPARIIPVWHEFISSRPDSVPRVRGIGEPIWAGRTGDEIVEAQRHESLINLAFHDAPGWILCPYDTTTLREDVLEEAYRSHPHVAVGNSREASRTYLSLNEIRPVMDLPLPQPQRPVEAMNIVPGGLGAARRFVASRADENGFPPEKIEDLKLVVTELAANTLTHGGGTGILRLWTEEPDLVLEVVDRGVFDQPLVGRRAPGLTQEGGRGMWMINQLCDLVQMRTLPEGSVIRIRLASH
jgi:anti-sigma regulatory factor (Ser/Thr protein kinase)